MTSTDIQDWKLRLAEERKEIIVPEGDFPTQDVAIRLAPPIIKSRLASDYGPLGDLLHRKDQ